MKRWTWMALGVVLAAAAAIRAAADDAPKAPRAFGYDIHADFIVTAGATCGHWATYDGGPAGLLDWTVNGVLVAQDAASVNYTNDGSPYTVAVGEVGGGGFTEYHAETFYPEQLPYVACFAAAP